MLNSLKGLILIFENPCLQRIYSGEMSPLLCIWEQEQYRETSPHFINSFQHVDCQNGILCSDANFAECKTRAVVECM